MAGSDSPGRRAIGRTLENADAARRVLGMDPGLCATCGWARIVESKSSSFLRCGASDTEPDRLRYPPLPVLECGSFVARDKDE